MINFRIGKALLCAGMLLAGCASVANEHVYTLLGRDSGQTANATVFSTRPGVVIAPVTIPESVDRRELVVRSGENSVTILDNHRWAESLKNAIPRVIAGDLSQLLDNTPVFLQSDNAARDAKYVLSIDVTRFDSTLNGTASIDILWSIRATDGSPLRSGKSSVNVPVSGSGYDDLIAAHVLALGKLSQEIAGQIKSL